jgi:hypothetical protein
MSGIDVLRVSIPLLLLLGSGVLEAGTVDITSDCGGWCTSITYSGAPGPNPTGMASTLNINGIWTTLADLGKTGQWISYAQTGLTGTGPLANQTVDFTVNYNVDPTFTVGSVTLNVLADDFAQATGSPNAYGPLPGWSALRIPGTHCSQTAPGCLATTLYTYTLNQSQVRMFASDNQIKFSVVQAVDNTPFGLAFDIQVSSGSPSVPEPGSLSLLTLGIAAFTLRRGRLFARLRSGLGL